MPLRHDLGLIRHLGLKWRLLALIHGGGHIKVTRLKGVTIQTVVASQQLASANVVAVERVIEEVCVGDLRGLHLLAHRGVV